MTFAADRSMLRLHLARLLSGKTSPGFVEMLQKKKKKRILGCSGCCEKETADLTPVSVVCRPPWNNQAVDGSQLHRLNLSSAEVLKGFYFVCSFFVFWLHKTETVESVTWRTLRVTLFDSKRVRAPTCLFCFPRQLQPVACCCSGEVWSPSFSILCLQFFFFLRAVPPPLRHRCLSFDRWLLEFPQVALRSPSFAAFALASLSWNATESWEVDSERKWHKESTGRKNPQLLFKNHFKFGFVFF